MVRVKFNNLDKKDQLEHYSYTTLEGVANKRGMISLAEGGQLDLSRHSVHEMGLSRNQDDLLIYIDKEKKPTKLEETIGAIRLCEFFCEDNVKTKLKLYDEVVTPKGFCEQLVQQFEIENIHTQEIDIIEMPKEGRLRINYDEVLILDEEDDNVQYSKKGEHFYLAYSSGALELLNPFDKLKLIENEILFEQEVSVGENETYTYSADYETYLTDDSAKISRSDVGELLDELASDEYADDLAVFDKMYCQKTNQRKVKINNNTKRLLKTISDQSKFSTMQEEKSFKKHYGTNDYFLGSEDDTGMPWDNEEAFVSELDVAVAVQEIQSELDMPQMLCVEGDVLTIDGAGIELDVMTLENEILSQLEVIDLTGEGDNSLTVSADEIKTTGENHELYVYGDETSIINLYGQDWCCEEEGSFTVYSSKDMVLYVDKGVGQVNRGA